MTNKTLMKAFIILSVLFINFGAFAQVNKISPLPCDTWGTDKYLSYEEAKNLFPEPPETPYKAVFVPSEERYLNYTKDKNVYSWNSPNYYYVNNIQVIRWNIQDDPSLYTFVVKNMFDQTIYEVKNGKSCGVIIFPDSVTKDRLITIEILTPKDEGFMFERNMAKVILQDKYEKAERMSILAEIKACTTLACKIEKLKAHDKILDIISLLELEKMKDPQNTTVNKLYWEFLSVLRYDYSGRSEER